VADLLTLHLDDEPMALAQDRGPELIAALRVERKLIGDLVNALRVQRNAVAADDIAGIDDSVFAAQRILLTLAQARTRRRTLLHIMTGREDVPLGELEAVLGVAATPSMLLARDDLREQAQVMGRELEVNRRILSGAIEAGDHLLRALTGTTSEPPSYTPTPTPPSSQDGVGAPGLLIDRQV